MFCRTLDLRSKSKNICLVEECSGSVDPDPSVSELLVSLVPLQLICRCKIDQFIGVWFLFQKPLKYIMLIAVRWCLLQIEKRVHLQTACLRRPPGSETARAGNPLVRRRNWKKEVKKPDWIRGKKSKKQPTPSLSAPPPPG